MYSIHSTVYVLLQLSVTLSVMGCANVPRRGCFLVYQGDKNDFLADKMSSLFVCVFTNSVCCILCVCVRVCVCVCLVCIRIDMQYVLESWKVSDAYMHFLAS